MQDDRTARERTAICEAWNVLHFNKQNAVRRELGVRLRQDIINRHPEQYRMKLVRWAPRMRRPSCSTTRTSTLTGKDPGSAQHGSGLAFMTEQVQCGG